jgi:hypothetical protein
LDLVGHEQDAELVAQPAEVFHPACGRDDDAALALDGFDEDGRDLVRIDFVAEQRVAKVVDGAGVRFACGGATRVGVRSVQNAGE